MSDEQTPKAPGKRPSHLAYQVSEGQDGKSYFNKVGAAFEHRDKQGYNVTLDAVPVDGRVTLRTPLERLQDLRSGKEPQAPTQQAQAEPTHQSEPKQPEAQQETPQQAEPQTQPQHEPEIDR